MAASDSVNDVSGWLDQRLAAASPDLLRAMIKQFAEVLMSADADTMCGAGQSRVQQWAGQLPQWLPGAGLGHPRGQHRAGHPQASVGVVFSEVAAGSVAGARSRP